MFDSLRLAIVLEFSLWASGFSNREELAFHAFGVWQPTGGTADGHLANLLAEIYSDNPVI